MATITEQVTTTEEVEYTTPVYIKKVATGFNLYAKIYSATKMIIVDSTAGTERIYIDSFPQSVFAQSVFQNINEHTESTDVEFEAQYDAVKAIIELIVYPA